MLGPFEANSIMAFFLRHFLMNMNHPFSYTSLVNFFREAWLSRLKEGMEHCRGQGRVSICMIKKWGKCGVESDVTAANIRTKQFSSKGLGLAPESALFLQPAGPT